MWTRFPRGCGGGGGGGGGIYAGGGGRGANGGWVSVTALSLHLDQTFA